MGDTRILRIAVDAARVGGKVLQRFHRDGVEIRSKQPGKSYDLVSDADLESEHAIANVIRQSFPDHQLVGEETLAGDLDADHAWVIDPLDGTNNFAHGLEHFAVSIGYYQRGRPMVGVVFNPARDDLFTAVAGGGARHNDKPVRVSSTKRLSGAMIGCGFYYDRGAMMRSTLATIEDLFGHDIHGIRRFGTASLDLCSVGCGQLDAFFEYKLSPWDFAAGRLFVEEAGGQITDARGQPLRLTTSGVLVSNGHLHDAVAEITRKHAG